MPPQTPHAIQRAVEMLTTGRAEEARTLLLAHARFAPKHPEVARLLAVACSTLGLHDQAEYHATRAYALSPTDPTLALLACNAVHNRGKMDEAEAMARRALAQHPADAPLREALADSLFQRARFADAGEQCRVGLDHAPGNRALSLTYASVLANTGRSAEAYAVMRGVLAAHPGEPDTASGIAQMATYLPGLSPEDVLRAHAEFGEILDRALPPRPRPAIRDKDPRRRLRVGFLSPDFRVHSVAYFLEPVLEHLDPRAFEIACYYTGVIDDAVTARFRKLAAIWRDRLPPMIEDLAEAIRRDDLDILVDLAGHTSSNRLAALQLRPAPVQASYLGYAATTGMRTVDYRIVDTHTDPPGADAFAVEKLLRIDPCFLCFRPPAESPPPATEPPCAAGGPVTFGSFNVLQKISDPLIDLWGRVLDGVPGSRLFLKNQGLLQQEVRDALAARLARAGIHADRVELAPALKSLAAHLHSYSRVDIALDTFPYHGTTTTCEALHMGVPVVTLAGPSHSSRVGVSILQAVGAPELIAATPDGYVAIATGLAKDPARLREYRAGLRGRLAASPLCDASGMGLRFGAALRTMWAEACAAG